MAEVKQVTLKRFNGTDEDTLHPTTEWDQVENKPSTFTATAHTLNSHTDVNASPTDGQALVWDGTNSLWVAGEGGGGSASVTISATEPTSPEEGDLWWDSTDGNLYIYYNDGTSSQWVEASAGMGGAVDKADLQNLYIYGKASVAITKGQAIQFAGAEGDHILIKPAVQSEINANPDYMIGIADSDLSIGTFGYVIVNGRLTLDTSTYTAGNILYFDSAGSTAGALTTTEPIGGTAILQMAAVSVSGVGNGEFVVRTMLLSREINEVIGLQTALDGKAASSHTHAISDVTGLQTALDGKATPADITTAIDDLVDLAPGSLDTLNELAAALGDDANFAGTVTTSLAGKSNVGHTHTKSEITDFAHTHDDRYYTESESDSRFVNVTGDTMTGSLQINSSGTIGGTTLSNGWLKIGTTLAMDTNEIYFGTTGYIGTTTANDLIFMYQATERARLTSAGVDVSGNLGVTGTVDGVDIASFKSSYDSHNHDGRYYTETEVNSLLGGKMSTSHPANNITSTHLYMANGDGFIWNDSTNRMYVRKDGADYELWDTGNFNPGSYLTTSGKAADANLLDGINSSQFVRSDTADTIAGNHEFYGTDTGGSYSNAPIEVREVNLVTSSQSSSAYAPAIAWHWGGRTQVSMRLLSNGKLTLDGGQTGQILTSTEGNAVSASRWATARTLSLTGDASGSTSWDGSGNASISVVVNNDSHTHDGRYYTESEADGRFLNVTGDTMTGAISMTTGASTHPGNSTPTALSYGKLTGYGSFFINADTDGSTTEYLYLTAGYGAGSTDGMRIGHATNSLTWKGQKVWNGHNLTFALSGSQLTITTS